MVVTQARGVGDIFNLAEHIHDQLIFLGSEVKRFKVRTTPHTSQHKNKTTLFHPDGTGLLYGVEAAFARQSNNKVVELKCAELRFCALIN